MASLIPTLKKKRISLLFIIIIFIIITLIVWQRFEAEQREKNETTYLILEVKKNYSNHNYEEALELLHQMDSSSNSSETRYKVFLYRGLIYSKINLFQRSLINFNLASKIKDSPMLKLSQALVYEKLQDENNTLFFLNEAHDLNSKNVFVLEKLGDFFFKKKNFYQASKYYEKSLKSEINEKKHRIIIKSLISFFLLNDQKKFSHYSNRLSHIEKNAKYQTFNLINTFNFFQQNKLSESIKILEKLIANSPTKQGKLEQQYLLGLLQIINQDFANGSENLIAAGWPLNAFFLSKILFFNGEPLKAIKTLEQEKDAHFLIALYYFYFKDYYSSLDYLNKIKSDHLEKTNIKLLMAKNHLKLNDFSAAEKVWQKLPREKILSQYEYLRYLLENNQTNRLLIEKDFLNYYAESKNPLLLLIMTKYHFSLKNYAVALNYLEKYFDLKTAEKHFHLLKFAGDLNVFAKKNNEKAIFYYSQVLENSNDDYLKNRTINNLSYVYYTKGDYLRANELLYSYTHNKEFPATYYNAYLLNNYLDETFKKNNSLFLLEKGINSIDENTPHDLISKIYLEASLIFYQNGNFNKYHFYLKKAFKYDIDNSKLQLLIKKNKIKI